MQIRDCGRTLRVDIDKQDADVTLETQGSPLGTGQIVGHQSHIAANDATIFLDFLNYPAHEVNRNRKADALGAGVLCQNGRVDANKLALAVDQCAARIACVDRSVGLDEVLESGEIQKSAPILK